MRESVKASVACGVSRISSVRAWVGKCSGAALAWCSNTNKTANQTELELSEAGGSERYRAPEGFFWKLLWHTEPRCASSAIEIRCSPLRGSLCPCLPAAREVNKSSRRGSSLLYNSSTKATLAWLTGLRHKRLEFVCLYNLQICLCEHKGFCNWTRLTGISDYKQ